MSLSRIAYLGPEGTFCEQALRALPHEGGFEPVPAATVQEAVQLVRQKEVPFCVVPLENSVEGAVGALHDELVRGESVVIVRQVLIEVVFGLYVRPGVETSDVRTVASHPHAYAQCRGWIAEHLSQARFVPTASTADAAAGVGQDAYDAAICAAVAGERYRLETAASDIADNSGAVTRFVELASPEISLSAPTGSDLTSLAVSLAHDRAGSLAEALTELASRGINLTRIESRPTKAMLGHYWFFLDAEGHIAERNMAAAVSALRKTSAELRFLGSYPR